MAAKSTNTFPNEQGSVKRVASGRYPENVTRSILRDLGKSPDSDETYTPPIPPAPRGDPRRESAAVSDALLDQIVDRLLDRFERRLAGLADFQRNVTSDDYLYCPECSHGECKHYHAQHPYSRKDIEKYMPTTESTIYTWLHDRKIPRPISGPPYEFDQHCIAVLKYDKTVIPSGHYHRATHLKLMATAQAEREEKRNRTSAKLSAHMTRVNARRRASTRKLTTTKKSTDSGKQRRSRR